MLFRGSFWIQHLSNENPLGRPIEHRCYASFIPKISTGWLESARPKRCGRDLPMHVLYALPREIEPPSWIDHLIWWLGCGPNIEWFTKGQKFAVYRAVSVLGKQGTHFGTLRVELDIEDEKETVLYKLPSTQCDYTEEKTLLETHQWNFGDKPICSVIPTCAFRVEYPLQPNRLEMIEFTDHDPNNPAYKQVVNRIRLKYEKELINEPFYLGRDTTAWTPRNLKLDWVGHESNLFAVSTHADKPVDDIGLAARNFFAEINQEWLTQ